MTESNPYIVFARSAEELTFRDFDWLVDARNYRRDLLETGYKQVELAERIQLAPVSNSSREPTVPKVSEHATLVNQSKVKAKEVIEDWPEWSPAVLELPLIRSKNDCAIVALSAVTGLEYKKAKVLAFHFGWASTKGLQRGFLEALLEAKTSHKAQHRPDLYVPREPLSSLSLPDSKVFLVYVKNHVVPVVSGVILNAEGCENRPVEAVIEISAPFEEEK